MAEKNPRLGPTRPTGAKSSRLTPTRALGPSLPSRGPSTVPQRDLAPTPAPAPMAAMDYTGGYDGGGGGAAGFAAPTMGVSEDDYLAGNASYQATLAALNAALKNYETDVEAQKKKYDVDYETSLGTLGYTRPVGTEGAPDYKPGAWNLTDANTASGKSYQSQLGDFASRGLLQSSLYDRARNDLMDQLNKQLTSVNTARTNFMDDLTRQLTGYKTEDTQKRQQARMEALASMAAV